MRSIDHGLHLSPQALCFKPPQDECEIIYRNGEGFAPSMAAAQGPKDQCQPFVSFRDGSKALTLSPVAAQLHFESRDG